MINLVIGHPIKHSLSPSLHQRLYEQQGINARMIPVDNPPLPDLITCIKTLNITLTAVTLPFKTDILQYVDVMSEEVKSIGAANTLIYRDQKIHAYNTDVDGIAAVLCEYALSGKRILIMGAGGAARAVGYYLKNKQASVFWMNRTTEKAKQLAALFGGEVISHPAAITADVIINTTSIGLNDEQTPLPDYVFTPNQIVFDVIYHPTTLLKDAQSQGAICLSGLTMFEAQAKKQIELAYGVT